ncbi:transglutaminase-like domain-containing protein [Candidatus Woesearchaeota archaeon]|nr:transglutaminase-like domain-containing protein [Candidatus Woesearchaeota archaeon]
MKSKSPSYIIILLLSSILTTPVLAETWYYTAKDIKVGIDISSSLTIQRSHDSQLDYVLANISFYPKDRENQDLIRFITTPEPEESDNHLIFTWENPSQNNLQFSINSEIASRNTIHKITDKVRFPVTNLPADIQSYTLPTEHIDINPEIRDLGNSLAQGEDDLFVVEVKIAEWVKNNINYDLSTLTADVSQKSSWVITTRQGVCDEITNLFISINRALGIPVRFISGIAYTNSPLFPEEWGAHGWAEVYFPNYGWIPFDATYGEFGYIDPTHIILSELHDSEDSATHYEWKGYNIDIDTNKLEVNSRLIEATGKEPAKITLQASPLYEKVGFGSYDLIEVSVSNLQDYYIADELTLVTSKDVEILGPESQVILLRPKESRTYSWVIQVDENLDEGYIYTLPFLVHSVGNATSEVTVKSTDDAATYSQLLVKKIQEQLTKDEKSLTPGLEFDCNMLSETVLLQDKAVVECTSKNTGNTKLSSVDVCVETDCKKIDLSIGESVSSVFQLTFDSPGIKQVIASIDSDTVSKTDTLEVEIYDIPSIKISELNYPDNVKYEDEFSIETLIEKESYSTPEDITLTIQLENTKKEWTIESLEESKRFNFMMQGSDLDQGENNIKLVITYHNQAGNDYTKDTNITVTLEELTFSQKFKNFFRNISRFFDNLFS